MSARRTPNTDSITASLSTEFLSFYSKITLKALANYSPGFALKPWVQKCRKRFVATLKELRRGLRFGGRQRNPFRVASSRQWTCVVPGLPKRNPGLELANAFSVGSKAASCLCRPTTTITFLISTTSSVDSAENSLKCNAHGVQCRRSLPQNQISHVLRRKTHEEKIKCRPRDLARDLDRQLCSGNGSNSGFARSFFAYPRVSRALPQTSG